MNEDTEKMLRLLSEQLESIIAELRKIRRATEATQFAPYAADINLREQGRAR